MQFVTYANESDNIIVDKNLRQIGSYDNIIFLTDVNILNPVIRIQGNVAESDDFNYAYIPELGKYYYVNNINIVSNTIYEISLHVDVLMTYSAEIRNQEAVINRNRDNYNLYLNDDYFKAQNNNIISYRKFSGQMNPLCYVLTMLD